MKREICFSLRFGLDIPICVELLFVPSLVEERLVEERRGEAALNANNGCCVLFLKVDSRFLCDLLVGIVLLFLTVMDGCCVELD